MVVNITTTSQAEFREQFGYHDFGEILCKFTPARDAQIVLELLLYFNPYRVLEVGTATGDMTANLTRWTAENALIFTIGLVQNDSIDSGKVLEQRYEMPDRSSWGSHANHFGLIHKVFFISADTMAYDFCRVAPLDFSFIDGGHDMVHALNDSSKVYQATSPGGIIVWHDFNANANWVKVREAIEKIGFAENVVHVKDTEVAFLIKK